jgi:hypothetical protein
MKTESVMGHAPPVRGYVWHVYPDPATPGVFAGDTPFGSDEPPAARGSPPVPERVVIFWRLDKGTPGIQNYPDGRTYLVLTESAEPPRLAAGWAAEAARLSDNFELDQRGDRSVRLIRVIGADETAWGPVEECEFQVDRG